MNMVKIKLLFVGCFTVLMVYGVVYSLYFGVTPTDEPFYISLPYRFILGDRPFIDEYNVVQSAGLFLLPFVKLYLYMKGSTEGIILFVRYLNFAFFSILTYLTYFAFKKYISKI